MRTKTKILLSSAASLAISAIVAFLVLSILGDIDRDSERIQIYLQIRQKTEALNLLTSRLPVQTGEELIRQIKIMQTSLDDLLSKINPVDIQEEFLARQIKTNIQNLEHAIEKLISTTINPAGSSSDQYIVLVSHLWMMIQFISDDTRQLMEFSQNDIDAARKKAAVLIVILFAGLIIIIAAISFFSSKSIIRAQESLQAALNKAEVGDRLLKTLMDHVPDGITITDRELNLKMVSRHGKDLLGINEMMSIEEVANGWTVYRSDGITPMPFEDLPMVRAVRQGELVNNLELTQLNKNGQKLPLLCNAGPILDAAGNITGGIVVWRDITDLRSSEKAMQENLERLQLALSASGSYAWSWNLKEDIVSYSESDGQLLGWHDKPISKAWQVTHPDDVDFLRKEVERAINERRNYEIDFRVIRPDNRKIMWLRSRAKVECDISGEPVRINGINIDITERKLAEEKLRESEQRFRSVAENMSEGLMLFDEEALIYQNSASLKIHGFRYPQETRLEHKDFPATWKGWDETGRLLDFEEWPVSRVLRHESFQDHVLRAVGMETGREFWASYNGCPIHAADGKLTLGFIILRDITEAKRTEEALLSYQHQVETEKRKMEAILKSLPVGVVVTDTQGGVILSNNMDEEIWGKRPLTSTVNDYVQYKAWWADSDKPVAPHEWASAQAVQKGISIHGQVLKIERFDGRFGYVYNSAVPIRDEEDRIVGSAVAIQDITDLRNSQEALYQLNDSLEQLVAERTELAELRAKQLQSLAVELIEAEERERRRIGELLHEDLQQILAAARYKLQAVCPNPLPESVADVLNLLEESIIKSRRLSHELCPPALYHTGLTAALTWLAMHMQDQFGLQVKLEIEISQTIENSAFKVFIFRTVQELLFNVVKHSGAKSASIVFKSSKDDILVTVSDRGRGFDPDVIKRSTSKLGLGLLSIRERASYIGGSFEIESSADRGSRISIKIPLASVKSDSPLRVVQTEKPDSAYEIARPICKRGIRVLFADDHKVMRQGLIQLMSGQPDIQVVGEAANGKEAVELSRQLRPDVVVMDVSMPVMNGIEATRRIKAELPETRIIGLSMFDDELTTAAMRDAGADAFVNKGGSVAEILAAIYGKDRNN
jgi:PAS domain S-box-containing protein